MMKRIPFNAGFVPALFVLMATVEAQVAEEATVEKAAGDELLWLALLTLGIAIAVGVWQLARVRKAKRTHEHSAMTEHDPKARGDRDPR